MRLIDADALKRAIKTECNPYGKPTIDFESGKKVLKIIDDSPTIEINIYDDISEVTDYSAYPVSEPERPKGKWIGDTDYESFQGSYEAYKCSICGHSLHWRDYCSNKYNFCPNCGADMRGDENE